MANASGTPERGRVIAGWLILLAAVIAGFIATVVTLNQTVFSAQGFVTHYLEALERRDVAAALATDGVTAVEGASDSLLAPDALGELSDIDVVAEEVFPDVRVVTVAYTLDGVAGETEFFVEASGTRFGLFNGWAFARSPISVLEVTPLHAAEFTVNGIRLSSAGANQPSAWQVLTPGRYVVSHDSRYLTATDVPVRATTPNSIVPAEVDVQASPEFVSQLQDEVDSFLQDCAAQQVLFPSGCPFGLPIDDRVESAPQWSIAEHPVISLVPGDTSDVWVAPETGGVAHLSVEVRSLFDGSLSRVEEDVPFTISWAVTLREDGGVSIDVL
jgi:hypothetical protein